MELRDWGGVSTTYEYDEAGRLSKTVMGNGAVVTYVYDDSGQLIEKEDKAPDGTIICRYAYTLDEMGNPTSMRMTQPLVPVVEPMNYTFSL